MDVSSWRRVEHRVTVKLDEDEMFDHEEEIRWGARKGKTQTIQVRTAGWPEFGSGGAEVDDTSRVRVYGLIPQAGRQGRGAQRQPRRDARRSSGRHRRGGQGRAREDLQAMSERGKPVNSAEILERAAEILSERGLHKGDFVNRETGREVCMMGAIKLAHGDEVVKGASSCLCATCIKDAAEHGWYAMPAHTPYPEFNLVPLGGWEAIPEFNDADETTHEDAVLMLKRAAELARGAE